ncbi:diguanylate cyclase (GGDEF)-like protein [Natronospira proteinivora]|uniref:Diguanylate cyclase (GGDEF)-like protein n=1 Tax=Natronospira proteinivora TaxID=1807133 RepID=A0ABT1GAJ0_9GAMM|nr:GGDEF domain-containing protein [Natronospira proteinivora]MCP1728345.1 diguanylate cyclase (GGDEF)-like protein [Natronospira proteinivora]
MPASQLHSYKEQDRLAALHSLNLLEPEQDDRFDVYPRILSKAMRAPIAFVGFMDADRQVLTSCLGLGSRETPREETFCTHVLDEGFMVIPDATQDSVFANKPAVVGDEHIRFYAGSVIKDPNGYPVGTLCALDREPRGISKDEEALLRDLTELLEADLFWQKKLKSAKQDLLENTFHDPVTGMARDALCHKSISSLVEDAKDSGSRVAVATVHFPRYDELVGTYGQEIADSAARELAQRAREVTSPDGVLARPESDRFVLAQPGLATPETGVDWAYRLHNSISAPVHVEDGRRDVKASMGIAIAPDDGQDSEQLLRCARLAMRIRSGPGLQFYAAQSDKHIRRRDRVSRHRATALEDDLLELHYQPIYDGKTGRVVTFEALARWNDAELGFISPGEFIPLAEKDSTLSRVLTRWVLERAIKDAEYWNRNADEPVKVNVNIAGPEFCQDDFLQLVENALRFSHLNREFLVLEITEETIIEDIDGAIESIGKLRAAGINVVLDDFGTGYSSLNYLRKLPLDGLKIDRSFVEDLPEDRASSDVAAAIAGIGKALDMRVVAEGVETEAQKALLCDLGCDSLQGFLFSKAVPVSQVSSLFKSTW